MAGGAVQHSICGGLVAVAMLVPACASATILTRCGSLDLDLAFGQIFPRSADCYICWRRSGPRNLQVFHDFSPSLASDCYNTQ
jgi:hypothetical protein